MKPEARFAGWRQGRTFRRIPRRVIAGIYDAGAFRQEVAADDAACRPGDGGERLHPAYRLADREGLDPVSGEESIADSGHWPGEGKDGKIRQALAQAPVRGK